MVAQVVPTRVVVLRTPFQPRHRNLGELLLEGTRLTRHAVDQTVDIVPVAVDEL